MTVCGEEVPLLVVGDSAYPMRPWLVKDFRGQVTAEQRAFNKKLNSARVVVEQVNNQACWFGR